MTVNEKLKRLRESVNRNANQKHNATGMHRPPIGFRLVQGKKGMDDKIIEINTHRYWRRISINFLLKVLRSLMINEDYLHPHPEKGRYLIVDLVRDLADGLDDLNIIQKLQNQYGGR